MDLATVRKQLGDVTWSRGWSVCRSAEEIALAAQLQRELAPGHSLHGRRCVALAHDRACDDVLFYFESPKPSLAVVHLTWQVPRASNAFPWVERFATVQHWARSIAV